MINKYGVRNYIENIELDKEEILHIFETIKLLKQAAYQHVKLPLLEGTSLAMIFEEASTRTRVSFEVAINDLGGHGLYLQPGAIHFGESEALQDTARVVSSMCDGIVLRIRDHKYLMEMAEHTRVPLFNGMTVYNHPTQGMCDLFTMWENLPEGKKFDDIKIAFVGDSGENGTLANEIGHMASSLGLHYTIASPKEYTMDSCKAERIRNRMAQTGGAFRIIEDPVEAVKEADYIVPDVWTYSGYQDEKEDRLSVFMPKYQLNMELMSHAPAHCKALHCLPAQREVEITSEVMDHPTKSLVFQEAENRLHTERGLLAWFMYQNMQRPTEEQKNYYKGAAEAFLKRF